MKTIKILLIIFLSNLTPNTTLAETLSYNAVINQAVNNSFDLKMSAVDIDISRSQLKAARSELYPTLSLQFNTEYNNNLSGNKNAFAYAGNTMLTPYTQFRDMLYLTLSYNLFDFGVTDKKVYIAKKELEQKELNYKIQLKELKLKVLDLYTKAHKYNNEIATKTQILALYEAMFHNKERMFQAGMTNKLSVMDEAVKIAKLQNDIENSKMNLKTTLADLSVFTQNKYDINNLELTPLPINAPEEENLIPISYENFYESNATKNQLIPDYDAFSSPEAAYYDLEIEKKQSELTILKRQLLPSFRFYTGYGLYGQNPNQYWGAIRDIEQRSLTVGISSTYVFFDGFKNKANREKTALEVKKLQIEKEKKIAELKNQYEKSYKTYESYNEELITNNNLLSSLKNKLDAVNRLNAQKLTEQNELFSVKADLLTQEYELEQNIINTTSKLVEMKIMTGENI